MQFEEFAADRLPAVLRFAGVLTGDRALAEDVVQEVLLRASQRWSQLQDLDHPEAYVRKMIVNEYLDWRRRNWRLFPNGTAAEIDTRVTPDHAGQPRKAGPADPAGFKQVAPPSTSSSATPSATPKASASASSK
jgi:DNA-directed RNA polymerase specialized sigma24 family protein